MVTNFVFQVRKLFKFMCFFLFVLSIGAAQFGAESILSDVRGYRGKERLSLPRVTLSNTHSCWLQSLRICLDLEFYRRR